MILVRFYLVFYTHRFFFLAIRVELSVAIETILMDVTGISMAAITGCSSPRTANHNPTQLYNSEMAKLTAITRLPLLQ